MKTLRQAFSRLLCLPKSISLRQGQEQYFLSTVIPPILLGAVLCMLQHESSNVLPRIQSNVTPRGQNEGCNFDPTRSDTCGLIREYCSDFDDDGLIPYLHLYYCAPPSARPAILIGMLAWLLILFAAMAAAAGDYLSVNLSIIVSTLDISESLAGVTIFAFGNGSSDLFSTLAAMNVNSGGLAITELFGAAAFITTVVLGLVAVTQPFTVNPSVFIGEVVWFILLASCLVAFLADGQLQLGECLGIVGLYIAFVTYSLLRPSQSDPRPELTPTTVPAEPVGADVVSDGVDVHGDEESDETTRLLASHSHPTNNSITQSHQPDLAQAHPLPDRVAAKPGFQEAIFKIFPGIHTWPTQSAGERALTIFSMPLLLPIGLTTPIDLEKLDHTPPSTSVSRVSDDSTASAFEESSITTISDTTQAQASNSGHRRMLLPRVWVLNIQFMFGPQLLAFAFVSQTSIVEATPYHFGLAAAWALPLSAFLIGFHAAAHHASSPRLATINHFFNATYAFMISLTWIYLASTSIVTLLKTIGFVLNIPEAILGATIFAVGNSSNDLVADPAVARRGFPVLAASACFGGPMMNMLLGIGIGGLVQILKTGSPGVYSFEVSAGLLVSVASLLLGLFATLVYAFYNSWRLDKRLALILMGIWSTFTILNVALGMARSSSTLLDA